MLSDGMLDFETISDDVPRMETILQNIKTTNAQRFADELMRAAPVPEDSHDDGTVLVAAVWETVRQKSRNL